MHTMKSSARKLAWYHNNDPESRTYNFFGRPNPHARRRYDAENGLSHIQSEGGLDNGGEKEWDHPSGIGGVRKSHTSPTSGPSHDRGLDTKLNDIEEKDYDKYSPEASNSDVQPSATGLEPDAPPRKRHGLHLPFGKKKKDQQDDSLTHTKSKQSQGPHKLTFGGQMRTIFMSWINILLVFVPVGLAFEYAHLNGPATFVMNFIAIIPLAALLSFATEELAGYVGETFGGLLNASFGNATELIVSIIALTQGKITIVQTSLIGSLLSNLLLVLGMCFFFGGLYRLKQFFNQVVAQTAASLLALAIGALVTPTAFRIFSQNDQGVTPTSRAAAVLLLLTYIAYLVFQLHTHTDMYNETGQKTAKQANVFKKKKDTDNDIQKGAAVIGARSAAHSGGAVNNDNLVNKDGANKRSDDDDYEPEEHVPQLGKWMALAVLAVATALIAVTSDGMVSAIDSITEPNGPLSEEFVGLILIPIVGNAAEHATAVTVAIKDKMDLAIGVAVGSSLQIALLVIPVMVIISWIGVGQSVMINNAPAVLTLNFDGFQVVVLFIAIILVNYVIQDGESHWLEGIMLFITYVIFAVAAWYYPAETTPN